MQREVQWCSVVALVGDDGDPRGMLAFDVACIPNGSIPAQRASIRTQTRILPESQPHDAERGRETPPLTQGRCRGLEAIRRALAASRYCSSGCVARALPKAWAQFSSAPFTLLPEAWQDAPLWLVTSMLAGGERGARCRSIGHFCCFVLPRPKWNNLGLDRHGKDPLPS